MIARKYFYSRSFLSLLLNVDFVCIGLAKNVLLLIALRCDETIEVSKRNLRHSENCFEISRNYQISVVTLAQFVSMVNFRKTLAIETFTQECSRMRTTHSSSHWGVCLSACRDTPPWVWAWRPPRCGPGDPPDQTPQLPPCVWAWKPARHAGIPQQPPPQRPAARHAGIPPAMHAWIPTPPPSEQNHRHM